MKKTSAYARKHRHCKPPDNLAGLRLLDRARPYEPGEMDDEHKNTEEAFARLRTGAGDEADFDRVSMLLNVGLIRAKQIDPQIVTIILAGQMAMARMKSRYIAGKSMAFDAIGLDAADYALETYRTVMDSSSPLQMINAIRDAYKLIMGGNLLEIPQ